jgi:hypothetical protein
VDAPVSGAQVCQQLATYPGTVRLWRGRGAVEKSSHARIDHQRLAGSAPAGQEAKAKKASNTKFTCSECGQNAWGKPDTQLICGACYDDGEGEICLMLAEPSDEAA